MLVMGGVATDEDAGRQLAARALTDGSALAKFAQWIDAQGGEAAIAKDVSLLPHAPYSWPVRAEREGYVAAFDAEGIGRAAMLLGAGRATKDDTIDPAAGLVLSVRVGDRVAAGDLLCTLYASSEGLFSAAEERFRSAVEFSTEPVEAPALFHRL
jgi:thymidine phosphorylase